jgi:MFS family permease
MAGVFAFPDRARVLHALRRRDFRLLWGGQTVSLIGDGAFLVALNWRVFALTHSTKSLGIVLIANGLAMLTTLLVGGALADRYERRTLMITSDLLRAGVVAGLAAVEATGHTSFGVLVVFAVGVGLGDGLFQPAFGGIVPLVVEQPLLASANSLIALSRFGSLLVGPGLAAVVYGSFGPATVFAADAGSFIFSAGLLWLARPRAIEREQAEGVFREIATGIRYVAGVPWLWVTIALASVVLMVGVAPFQVLLPKLVQQHFHRGVAAFGLLYALMGGGMALGTLLFGQINPRRNRAIVTYGAWAATDACRLVIALSPSYALAAGMQFGRGATAAFGIGIWETMLMERVPENRLARVISLDWFGSFGLTPIGYAVAAGVSGLASPSVIIAAGASIGVALWLLALLPRSIRSVG